MRLLFIHYVVAALLSLAYIAVAQVSDIEWAIVVQKTVTAISATDDTTTDDCSKQLPVQESALIIDSLLPPLPSHVEVGSHSEEYLSSMLKRRLINEPKEAKKGAPKEGKGNLKAKAEGKDKGKPKKQKQKAKGKPKPPGEDSWVTSEPTENGFTTEPSEQLTILVE